jgi:excinuclease ABC subunit A
VCTSTELSHLLCALALTRGERVCPVTGEALLAGGREPLVQRVLELPEDTVVLFCAPVAMPTDGGQALLAELLLQGVLRVRFAGETHRVDALSRLPTRGELLLVLDRLRVRADRVDRLREAAEQALRAGAGRATVVVEELGLVLQSAELPYSAALGRALSALRIELLDPAQGGLCGDCGGTGCAACGDSGCGEGPRSVRLGGDTLAAVLQRDIAGLAAWWSGAGMLDDGPLARRFQALLQLHLELDLGALPLLRPASALASSEWSRLLLVEALTDLTPGTLLVLDEPGARLDAAQGRRLAAVLQRTVFAGVGVMCVDHNEQVRAAAALEVGFGPGAGAQGGRVVYLGPPRPPSVEPLPAPIGLAPNVPMLTLSSPAVGPLGPTLLRLPIGRWTAIVGENGAGKSTLVRDVLGGALRGTGLGRVEGPELQPWFVGDRRPPGGPRSVVATALGVWSAVRTALAATREARALGWTAQRFSFNGEGGRCAACQGSGVVQDELGTLGAPLRACAACGGGRFGPEIKQVRWRGFAADELLGLELSEALPLFAANPQVGPALRAAGLVGLGYLTLGQRSDSLSGGEAQRLALAASLANAERTGRAREGILVLDSPSAGLHEADAASLARALDGLRSAGLTIVVADLHAAFVQPADLVIELSGGRARPRGEGLG